ncbi:MAG: glycosyltransferase family 9 protein [Chloroflexi bacterium]|nr:glycosyltransferase family 9 protein [Chloroflexota bacterium]
MADHGDLRLRLLRLAGRLRAPRQMPKEPRSILIVRPDHLGDLVLASAALPALRRAYPDARLTAWLGPWGEPVWRPTPYLDAIETCPFPGFTRQAKANTLGPYSLAAREAAQLRGRFDLAINLRFDFWWGAMAACWARIPVAGYDVPECRPFLASTIHYQPARHEIDQTLRLVEAVTGQAAEAEDAGLFPEPGPSPDSPDDAIAIHPGAGAAVKLWTDERWATLADALAQDAPIVLMAGGPDEVGMAERIRSLMAQPAAVLSGMDLLQLASALRRCRLLVGPDNGPVHIARAVGTPTVALFGPTDPRQFGPTGHEDGPHEVVSGGWSCVPCRRLDYTPGELIYHPCVRLIEPADVLAAARRVLTAQQSRSC